MSSGPCKLLCVGDIHLGRLPSRIPDDLLAELGRSRSELGPAEALERSVRRAVEEEVDAVLFAGDLVEGEEDFFEAYPRLQRAVSQLVEHGIEVLAVAGNHDVRVLPRLADEVEGLTLLGRAGRWQSHIVKRADTPLLRVVGWSFPEREVRNSPLATFPSAWSARRFEDDAPDSLTTIGLLHADLDAAGGAYAPVARKELAARGLEGWLCGHVHAPDRERLRESVPIGYLGSLSALDPGEPGVHGPWLGRVEAGRLVLGQLALSPMRYEPRELKIDGVEVAEELDAVLLAAVREAHVELAPTLSSAQAVALRLRLRGECRIEHAEIEACAKRVVGGGDHGPGLRVWPDGPVCFVESVIDQTRPAIDLRALAEGKDPVSLFARRILALEARDDEGMRLVELASVALARSARVNDSSFSVVSLDERDPEAVRALLSSTARRALEELLKQRASSPETSA